MSETVEFQAQPRTEAGKAASRRTRHLDNLIPCILYGGAEEPEKLTLPWNVFAKAIEDESIFSQIVTVNSENKSARAIIKAVQRHPATSSASAMIKKSP